MTAIPAIKSTLIADLWLPLAVKSSSIFYPRLRRNKGMKVFTLTDESNSEEIAAMIGSKLTSYERIIAWTSSMHKRYRLESSLPNALRVIGDIRYEDSTPSYDAMLLNHFPFDILNLDFSSQNQYGYAGRVEKEMKAVELAFKMQKETVSNLEGFVLFYTTILDSENVNCQTIKTCSDDIRVPAWSGLDMDPLPLNALDNDQKIATIKKVLEGVSRKYRFCLSEEKSSSLTTGSDCVYSIVGIFGVA